MTAFRNPVTTEAELRALMGTPSAGAVAKQIDVLDVHCRAFIARNPHVGLIFLLPGGEETPRVNGKAWIVRDEDLLAR